LLDFLRKRAPYAASLQGVAVRIKLLIGLSIAGLVVVAAVGYKAMSTYQHNTTAAIEGRQRAADDAETRETLRARVDALGQDGCQSRVVSLFAIHNKKAITSASEVPAELRNDLAICLERGILYAYLRDELSDAGLTRFLTPAQ
jgi:hypothetical protein